MQGVLGFLIINSTSTCLPVPVRILILLVLFICINARLMFKVFYLCIVIRQTVSFKDEYMYVRVAFCVYVKRISCIRNFLK